MRVGQRPKSTVNQVIQHINNSGLIIPNELRFRGSLLCACYGCRAYGPLNGDPICVATDGRKIFFYGEDCDLKEGHELIEIESGDELQELVLATFDLALVYPMARRREAAAC